jgi:glycosyltransferase involved in cell wall biosynthesis
MMIERSKADQTTSNRSQAADGIPGSQAIKPQDPITHGLRIIRQEGFVRFIGLSFRKLISQLVLFGYLVRFYLTKPRHARIIKIGDIDQSRDASLITPETHPTSQAYHAENRGDAFSQDDKVQEGAHWYARMASERVELISEGQVRFNGRRVLFVLPVLGAGGGSNSVFLAAQAMRKMGVDAQIMNLEANRKPFMKSYPNVGVPVFFGTIQDIPSTAIQYDAVVATSNITVAWIAPALDLRADLVMGYYIQDYEAYFYPPGSEGYRHAADSYTLIRNQVRCVTTEWIADQIRHHHEIDCHLVGGHIDTDLFRPRPLASSSVGSQPIRIAAMIRPVSRRRSPGMTMEILQQVSRRYGSKLEFVLFGCEPHDPDFASLPKDFPWKLAGELRPAQIANLLNESDIFVDYSVFQALGLTALEAMASGAASIVPSNGGTSTFARHAENCLVVDTSDSSASYAALQRLIEDDTLRQKIQRNAIQTGVRFYPELPAFNILKALFP